jgi:mono/diheme cytochrome c family protein
MDHPGTGVTFLANCATCHRWTGQGVGASDANNLVMVVLNGVNRPMKQVHVLMPAFRAELSNDQIAAITNYVTKQFGNPQSTVTADQVAILRMHSKRHDRR